MTLHADARAVLSAWTAPDADQERLRLDYLALLETRTDALWRSCRPDHLTASAVVLDTTGRETLLVLHGRIGRWVQPGGHCEPGDGTLEAAAGREVGEETALPGLELGRSPVLLSRHGSPCGAEHHLDVQYLATAPTAARPTVSAESRDVRWFPVDDLPADLAAGVDVSVAAACRAIV